MGNAASPFGGMLMLTGPYFDGLDEGILSELDGSARRVRFAPGEALFTRGGAASQVFVLLSGRVRISRPMADGGDRLIEFALKGDVIGSLAVVQNSPHPVTAIAADEVQAASWSAAQFRAAIAKHPALAVRALRLVAQRANQVLDLMEEIGSVPLEQRLARVLLRLAADCGRDCDDADGDDRVSLKLTRQDLAELTGVTLPTVSRVMSRWRSEGLIGGYRGAVIIESIARLSVLADLDTDEPRD